MALTKTSLSVALDADDLTFTVAAATGATVGGLAKIEDEYSVITEILGTSITVRSRGDRGTKAVAHNTGAACTFLLTTDVPAGAPGKSEVGVLRDIKYYTAAGAISLPTTRDAVAVIGVGAGAGVAYTLADPSTLASGLLIHIVSASAYAHTVTLTTGYGGDAETSIFTFSGAVGDSVTLLSLNGTWSHVVTGLIAADTVSVTVSS